MYTLSHTLSKRLTGRALQESTHPLREIPLGFWGINTERACLDVDTGRNLGDHDPVAAFPLGTIKRGIGGLEQIAFARPMIWESGHSDGSGDESKRLAIVHDYEVTEFRSDALGAGLGRAQIGSRQNDDELFPAIAADKILSANAAHKK